MFNKLISNNLFLKFFIATKFFLAEEKIVKENKIAENDIAKNAIEDVAKLYPNHEGFSVRKLHSFAPSLSKNFLIKFAEENGYIMLDGRFWKL